MTSLEFTKAFYSIVRQNAIRDGMPSELTEQWIANDKAKAQPLGWPVWDGKMAAELHSPSTSLALDWYSLNRWRIIQEQYHTVFTMEYSPA